MKRCQWLDGTSTEMTSSSRYLGETTTLFSMLAVGARRHDYFEGSMTPADVRADLALTARLCGWTLAVALGYGAWRLVG